MWGIFPFCKWPKIKKCYSLLVTLLFIYKLRHDTLLANYFTCSDIYGNFIQQHGQHTSDLQYICCYVSSQSAVWPDLGIKSTRNSPILAQKVTRVDFCFKSDIFQDLPGFHQIFLLLFISIPPRT